MAQLKFRPKNKESRRELFVKTTFFKVPVMNSSNIAAVFRCSVTHKAVPVSKSCITQRGFFSG
jgi:hypothetical protein